MWINENGELMIGDCIIGGVYVASTELYFYAEIDE